MEHHPGCSASSYRVPSGITRCKNSTLPCAKTRSSHYRLSATTALAIEIDDWKVEVIFATSRNASPR